MRSPWKNLAFCLVGAACLCGCATMSETGKKVWGSSVEHLESQRPQAARETFDLPLQAAFEKTENILTKAGATVYLTGKDREYLAAMNFKGYVDTTQVGVFFISVTPGQTRLEVASMVPRLTKEVGQLIFKQLKEVR